MACGNNILSRGPSPARDSSGHCRNRFLHRVREEAARVAVGDQPPDSPARRRARRAAVPARRPSGADDAGGREPRAARPARVPRRPRDGRVDHRSDARAARHAAAVRRHDGLPLRVSAAAEAPAPRPSASRRPADGRPGGAVGAGDSRRARRRRPADAAGRGDRPGDGAGAARGAPADDVADASAGEAAEGAGRETWPGCRSSCSRSARRPAR